jgi:hypothetical protein
LSLEVLPLLALRITSSSLLSRLPLPSQDEPLEFLCDFLWVRPLFNSEPKSEEKGEETFVFDIVNRGLPLAWSILNNALMGRSSLLDSPLPLGDSFILRKGWNYVALGWQQDLVPRPGLSFKLDWTPESLSRTRLGTPKPIRVLTEIDSSTQFLRLPGQLPLPDTRSLSLASAGHFPLSASDSEQPDARLFELEGLYQGPSREIPRAHWCFGKPASSPSSETVTSSSPSSALPFEVIPDRVNITSFEPNGGFKKGSIYRVIYHTQDALPAGVGLTALRDCATWLKSSTSSSSSSSSSSSMSRIYAIGGSQTGRLLRTFISDGFNKSSTNIKPFDGFSIWVAGASRGQFNQLGGQPSQSLPHLSPIGFPFSPSQSSDQITGEKGALREKGEEEEKEAKVIYINTSIEYHRGDASLLHISTSGQADLVLPDNVRVYMLTGAPHNPIPSWPPSYGDGIPLSTGMKVQQILTNSIVLSYFFRSSLLNLHEWITKALPPPPNSHPTLTGKTLVHPGKVYRKFDKDGQLERCIDTSASHPPPSGCESRLWRRDFGYSLTTGQCSILPAKEGLVYEGSLVPEIDEDGNDLGGIKHPIVRVPLGIHTGWALRSEEVGGEQRLMMVSGGFIPYRKEKLRELYPGNKEEWFGNVRTFSEDLIKQRWLLEEDLKGCLTEAERFWDWSETLA